MEMIGQERWTQVDLFVWGGQSNYELLRVKVASMVILFTYEGRVSRDSSRSSKHCRLAGHYLQSPDGHSVFGTGWENENDC